MIVSYVIQNEMLYFTRNISSFGWRECKSDRERRGVRQRIGRRILQYMTAIK